MPRERRSRLRFAAAATRRGTRQAMRRRLKLTIWSLCGLLALAALDATQTLGSHPRPKGATPMRISLAVAYRSCTPPTQTEPIVFQSNRDGNDEIYSMNEDGTGQTRL